MTIVAPGSAAAADVEGELAPEKFAPRSPKEEDLRKNLGRLLVESPGIAVASESPMDPERQGPPSRNMAGVGAAVVPWV